MGPKLTLHSITIRHCRELERKFEIAAECGYAGLDLEETDVLRYLEQGHTQDDLAALRSRFDLVVTHNGYLSDFQFIDGPPVVCKFTREETDDLDDLRRATDDFFAHCGALKCENALVLSSIERSGTVERAAEDLGKLGEWAARFKIRLAYEFMGFAKQIRDLPTAWEIVRKVDRENVGLCIDTFHVYRGKSRIDSIRQVQKEKIFFVHLNDAKQRPVEQLGDYDRVYPGEGVLPVREVLQALKDIGYDGYYSIEIYNEDYWKVDPKEVATKAKEKAEALFARLGH